MRSAGEARLAMGKGAAMSRYSPWFLLVVLLGAVTTVALLAFEPKTAEVIGLCWIPFGLPWSALFVGGGLVLGLLPDNASVNLFVLLLCNLANVGVVHLIENGIRRKAGSREHEGRNG